MRTILAFLFLLLYLTVFSLPAWLIIRIIRLFSPDKADRAALACVRNGFKVLAWLSGIHLDVKGEELIPSDRAVLFVSNHRSYFDIVIGYSLMRHLTGFVAKKQVLKVPSLNVWMRMVYCQSLDRENLREGMNTIKACAELIKEKQISIWICPEGTRNHEPEMLPFKEGSFKIAELAGCPVVPVAMTHTDDIFENHFPWIHSTNITVEFGAPLETAGLDRAGRKALPGQVRSEIEGMYERNSGTVVKK